MRYGVIYYNWSPGCNQLLLTAPHLRKKLHNMCQPWLTKYTFLTTLPAYDTSSVKLVGEKEQKVSQRLRVSIYILPRRQLQKRCVTRGCSAGCFSHFVYCVSSESDCSASLKFGTFLKRGMHTAKTVHLCYVFI